MTTVTKALDHLTDVLAGSDVTLKGTKADCIMQLADMIEDGTIVIGGGGGGEGALIVHFGQEGATYTSDKTYAEIAAAVEDGKAVFGTKTNGTEYCLLGAVAEMGAGFQTFNITEDVLYYSMMIVGTDDSVTEVAADYDLSSLVVV